MSENSSELVVSDEVEAPESQNDNYASDSDEEVERNTIGRVPLHWYDGYDHIGYDLEGKKIMKGKGDRIDAALEAADGKGLIYDMYNDEKIELSEREMELYKRIQAGKIAEKDFDEYPEYIDYASSIKEDMPLSAAPEPKRRFVPSKWEMMKVNKIVQLMKEGKYKSIKTLEEERQLERNKPDFYMIWNDDKADILSESFYNKYHLPAPKIALPGHEESYNPPPEYILTEEELKQREETGEDEKQGAFIPKGHECLRHVGVYDNFVKERFERCLDLYLAPRKLKQRLNIDPETLLPRLPKPKELRPFPNKLCLQYLGHTQAVRAISVSPDGQYLASASEDGTVRVWEVDTCLCRSVWDLKAPVSGLAWNPSSSINLLAAAVENKVIIIATSTGDKDSCEMTAALLKSSAEQYAQVVARTGGEIGEEGAGEKEESDQEDRGDGENESVKIDDKVPAKVVCKWHFLHVGNKQQRHGCEVGPRIEITFRATVTTLSWHHKGDYLGTVVPSAGAKGVSVHQLSKGRTQAPFTKSPGLVQSLSFHPSRPFLFVATQQYVKIYNLVEQKLVKKLISGVKWISSMAIHSSGDHCLIGSYDRRVVWFDLDLSSTPYKTMKYHQQAVRALAYHPKYPLMASASDDGNIHIFHSAVYSDLTRNPLIVPLKVLKGHKTTKKIGATAVQFHPKQPWAFSGGGDGVINCFMDV